MTAMDDFDRRLAQFLEDGPARAPERPVDLAIAHALAHPRRRDPFAALRSDPMGRRSAWVGRPALVFAVLGLLLVVSAAAFVVGSQPRQQVVPPGPSSAPPSAPASASPTPTAVPTPRTISAQVVNGNGLATTVEVVDESGLLTEAVGFPAEPDRFQNAEIEVIQLPADEGAGDRAVIVMWTDLSCPGPHRLTIDETVSQLVLEPQSCSVDSIGVDYQLMLQFSEPVQASQIDARIVRP